MFWFRRNRKPKPLSPDCERELSTLVGIVNSCRHSLCRGYLDSDEVLSQSYRRIVCNSLRRIQKMGKAATDRLPPEFFDENWPDPCEPFYETVLQPAAPSPTRAVLGEPENPNELGASPPPVSSLLTAVPAVPSAVTPNPPPTLTVPAVEAIPATWPSVPTSPPAPVLSNDPATWDTGIGGPSVRLHWTASRGNPTTAYDLYRNESLYYLGLASTTFIDNASLIGGQTYTYYVNARNGVGAKATLPTNADRRNKPPGRRGPTTWTCPSRKAQRLQRPPVGTASPGPVQRIPQRPILRLHEGSRSDGTIPQRPDVAEELPSDLFGPAAQSRSRTQFPGPRGHGSRCVLAGSSAIALGKARHRRRHARRQIPRPGRHHRRTKGEGESEARPNRLHRKDSPRKGSGEVTEESPGEELGSHNRHRRVSGH